MTSNSPFLLELSTGLTSPFEKRTNDFPPPPGCPLPCGKRLSPLLTLELPQASKTGYSDHHNQTVGPSPNAGKRCKNPPPPKDPCFTGMSPSLPPRISSPPYCHGPRHSSSSPTNPCFDRFGFPESPSVRQRSTVCSWINSPRKQHPCPPSPYFEQQPYHCCCGQVTSPVTHQAPGTSPMTSPQLTHVCLETGPLISPPFIQGSQGTCPIISPPLTHRPPGTSLIISSPLVHRPMETRPIFSPIISHKVLEIGTMTSPLLSHWSSGRSYNDPPLSPASSPATGSLYQCHLKLPDSCEPKPQLDQSIGKNCGCQLSSQAGMSGSPNSPEEGSFHLPPEAHISAPGTAYCAIHLSPESKGSPCSPQSQVSGKPCFDPLLSWETDQSSYLFVTPGTVISGPPCPPESSLPQCPCSGLCYSSHLGNQFIAPPQSAPRRSYNEPPLPTPVSPQMKSPKFSDLRQQHILHKCHSLVNTPQHASGHPKPSEAGTSPLPPSCFSGPRVEPSVTTPLNSCPKELPPGTALPAMCPGIVKTTAPTSLPLSLPCEPVIPNSYPKSNPHRPPLVPPCNTHLYSVVPTTSHPCQLPGSLNRSTVPPCGTYGTPRGPPVLHCKPVAPPCSTHIYSFIPLRTPFDPQSLPIIPRARPYPDTIPCGLHNYSVASQGPSRVPLQIPYSCPLPSPKNSICSNDPSCSSSIVTSESHVNESNNRTVSKKKSNIKSPKHSESGSQSSSPYHSRSRSQSPQDNRNQSRGQSKVEDETESPQSKSSDHGRSRKKSKSPRNGKSQGRSKSPQNKKKGQGRNKSPRQKK
ncbi:hypothetical protein H1C71_033609, partial [Ictidomys tridecemlineatus]|uniref:Uncharacterized protein n=1 Tax=Ictidomys tridecemlineatus TaxID=43179 RepID=A0A287CV44_ICTTR